MERPKRRAAAAASFLPDDAIVEILSRVPAKSLCRFKCVSKGWRDLISDRLRCKNLPQTLEGFFYDDLEIDGGDSDDAYCCIGEDRGTPCIIRGHFINTWGRSVPLVDPSFSSMLKQPGIESVGLLQSCNGLLLFGHKRVCEKHYSLGYIVCNPATEQWMFVPSSGWTPFEYPGLDLDEGEDSDSDSESGDFTVTYLIFDPAVSSHFHLVQFGMDCISDVDIVYTYSSETGVWSEGASEWSEDDGMIHVVGSAFLHGMLHLSFGPSLNSFGTGREQIVAVDVQGKKCRTMSWPEKRGHAVFVGQSQGHLHYMTQRRDNGCEVTELCIWVLQDYDAEEWVLKHRVSFMQLFGRMSCQFVDDYLVVTVHPDRNVIFFVQHWDRKLKSYDLDSGEVFTLRTLGQRARSIVPYFPYFSESPVLANKH